MSAIQLIKTTNLTREEWLAERKKGIGGSDAAAVCGKNKYKSRFQLWLEKTGQVDEPDLSDKEAVQWGNKLEDLIAGEFTNRTGLKTRRVNSILQHPNNTFMIANIDRAIVGKNEGLEIKTTSAFLSQNWKADQLPDAYYLQCQHYLAVTGWEKWHIACLIGGQNLVIKEIPRNEQVISDLIKIEGEFWGMVETMTAPEVDGSEASGKALLSLYPESFSSELIDLPPSMEDWATSWLACDKEIKELESRKTLAENHLKQSLGENGLGLAGRCLVSWKSTNPVRRFDTAKFQKDQPELYAQYLKEGNPSRRFSIKNQEEEENNG